MGTTTKKGKGKLPSFCGNGERLIPIYGEMVQNWRVLVYSPLFDWFYIVVLSLLIHIGSACKYGDIKESKK